MKAKLIPVLLGLVASGCATDINLKNAQTYYNAGLRAETDQDWPAAKEAYRRALINARSGGASPALVSAATYNLGRMNGYTCNYVDAEALLLESVELEQALPGPDAGNMTKRWSELARLYQDEARDRDAVVFYAKAVPELERLGVAGQDPIGFANYLDDYASALKATGNVPSASSASAQAAELRGKHTGQSAKFTPLRFDDVCHRSGHV